MRIPGLHGLGPGALATRAVKGFIDDDMATHAAALAFRILLALFPFALFLLTLLGALRLPRFFDWLLEQARVALPAQAAGQVATVVGEVRAGGQGGLLSFGLVAALWAASAGVRATMHALNVAYDVAETRPLWRRYPLSLAYTVGLAALLIAAAGLMLLGPRAMGWLAGRVGLADLVVALWAWLRWPAATLLLALAVAIVYYAAPNVEQPFRLITPGAVVAVIAWLLASLGFSYYVGHFGDYGATYGSLGGVVVLLLYFFISSAALLLGAEVNAEIHHARQGDRGDSRGDAGAGRAGRTR